MVVAILSAYCINVIINPVYHYDIQALKFNFQFNYIVILFMIVIGLLVWLSHELKEVEYNIADNKKIIKV